MGGASLGDVVWIFQYNALSIASFSVLDHLDSCDLSKPSRCSIRKMSSNWPKKNFYLTINIIYPRDHSTIYSPFRGFEKLETTNYIKGLLTNCGLLSHALRYWFLRFSNILYLRKMAGNLKKKIYTIYRSSDDISQSADVANLRVCSI